MAFNKSLLQKGLPKEIKSLCPECKKIISAIIYEKDGEVMMKKTCEKHVSFEVKKDQVLGGNTLLKFLSG